MGYAAMQPPTQLRCPTACSCRVVQLEMERLSLKKAAPTDKAAVARLQALDLQLDSESLLHCCKLHASLTQTPSVTTAPLC